MEKKSRAKNNRTTTIAPEELQSLRENIIVNHHTLSSSDWTDKIIHIDLFEILDYIPNQIADLVILDPPYNLSKDFNGLTFNARSNEAYRNYLESWFHRVCAKLKPHGSLYFCGDWRNTSVLQSLMETELEILNRITWQREKGRGALKNWKNCMEDIWFGVKDPQQYFFNVEAVKQKRRVLAPYRENGEAKDWEEEDNEKFRLTYPSNFWDDISIPFWSMPENTDHPTQKPEKLFAKLILASSKEGDLVFDPFLGSGTSAVVAKKLQRHYLGIEINEEYCLWAAKRIQNASFDSSIQGYSDGLFWERNTQIQQKRKKERPSSPRNLFSSILDNTRH